MIAERLGLLEEYTGGKIDPRAHQARLRDLARAPTSSAGRSSTRRATTWCPPPTAGKTCRPASTTSTRTPRSTRSPRRPASSSSRPPAWPSTSPTTSSGRRCPSGSPRASATRRPSAPSAPRSIRCSSCSNHPRWSVHSQHDDITWLREIETCKVTGPDGYQYQPVWLHPSDAEQRGIKHGDIVSIFNERGTVLGGAYVTERIMPGVVVHRPRRQVGPHRARRDRPRRRHQHHRAAQHDLQERRRPRGERLPGRRREDRHGRRSSASTRRPSRSRSTPVPDRAWRPASWGRCDGQGPGHRLTICNGCHNCQVACKDEHVGNDWSPIAKPQPDTGQFWNKVDDMTCAARCPRSRSPTCTASASTATTRPASRRATSTPSTSATTAPSSSTPTSAAATSSACRPAPTRTSSTSTTR